MFDKEMKSQIVNLPLQKYKLEVEAKLKLDLYKEECRFKIEIKKQEEETSRLIAETEKIKAETNRIKVELATLVAETEKITAETNKIKVEPATLIAETAKIKAETEKLKTEANRNKIENNSIKRPAAATAAKTLRVLAQKKPCIASAASARTTADSPKRIFRIPQYQDGYTRPKRGISSNVSTREINKKNLDANALII